MERWAAGREIDRAAALEETYRYSRRSSSLTVWATGVWAAALSVVVGAIAGAAWNRLVEYAIRGAVVGIAVQLIAYHSILEAMQRPVRIALAGDTGIGDSLPKSRPSFATRSNASMLAAAFAYAVAGAIFATVLHPVSDAPILSAVIGCALTLVFAVPVVQTRGRSIHLRWPCRRSYGR